MSADSSQAPIQANHDPSRPSPPKRCTKLFEYGAVLLILLVIVLAVARIYLTPPLWPKNFGFHDDRYLFGPNAFFLDTSLNNGEFPLWNPMTYSGTPFAAEPETTAFYPPHLLRSLLTPAYDPYATAVSLQIMLLAHVLLCGLGLYLLARAYAISPWGAMAGALAFMLGPYNIIYTTEFYIYTVAFAWGPWVLWLARRTLTAQNTTDTIRYALWTALCFGFNLLGMFPQLTLYLGLMLGFYVILDRLFRLGPPKGTPILRHAAITVGRGVFLLGVVALLGIMAGAVVLLPAFEFGRLTARTASAGLEVAPWGQDLGFFHLLKCLVVFPGNTWWPQGCRAAGIGSLLALLAALGYKNRRDVLVFLALFLIMTDLTLGPPYPFGSLLRAVDPLNITVSPWRAGIFASLCFAMLVAFGVDAAAEACARRKTKVLRTVLLLVAGIAMLLLLITWLNDEPLLDPGFPGWLVPLLTLLAMIIFTWTARPTWARATIGTLICLEIVVWSGAMIPAYVSTHIGGQSTADFGTAKELWQDNYRSAVAKGNWHMWTLQPATNGYGPMYLAQTRKIICHPALETKYRIVVRDDDIQVANQRGNLFLKRSFWLARQWVPGPLPGKTEVYPAATTVFLPEVESGNPLPVPEVPRDTVSGHPTSDATQQIDLGEGTALQNAIQVSGKNSALTLPPCETDFAHSVLYVGYISTGNVDISPVAVDETGTPVKLFRHRAVRTNGGERLLTFPLPDGQTQTITLHWPASANQGLTLTRAYVVRDLHDEDGMIQILHRRANSVQVQLTGLPAHRILTFVDAAYPGWHVDVDGEDAEVLLANDGFKAVIVPPGDHVVTFRFRSRPTQAGLLITILTFAALGTALLLLSRRASIQNRP